jgi:hypothetical protein
MKVENLDGGVKDHDLFVLEDEDDDDDDDDVSMDGEEDGRVWRSAAPPPPDVVPTVSPLLVTPPPPSFTDHTEELPIANATPTPQTPSEDPPAKPDVPVAYRLRRGDTLMGIALRFRLDVRLFHGSRQFFPPPFCLTDRTIRRWNYVG